jgi:tetratricopeptide (TPR) repeat protein
MDEAAVLYEEGTAMYDSADYSGAIEKFTKALGIVTSVNGDDRTRLTLLYNIAAAHEKGFSIDKDISHLRQALELYKRYRDFAQTTGDLGEELDVETRIAKLERRLRTRDQVEANRAANRKVPPPPVTAVPEADWKKPRNTGIALVAVGGAVTIGGVIMAVTGSRFEANAQAQVDKLAAMGVPPTDPAWIEGEAFVQSEKKKGNALMGTGATLAIVGAAGVGVGAYFLVKSKKLRNGSVSVIPALSPGFAGIQISGSF